MNILVLLKSTWGLNESLEFWRGFDAIFQENKCLPGLGRFDLHSRNRMGRALTSSKLKLVPYRGLS
jgi:hypothetical protein